MKSAHLVSGASVSLASVVLTFITDGKPLSLKDFSDIITVKLLSRELCLG